MKPACRVQQVLSPVIPLVAEWTAASPGTISLGQGVVHYAAPPAVAEAVVQGVRHDARVDRYGSVAGLPELLESIAQKVALDNNIDASGYCTLFTAGSNLAFANAILAIADVGDEIILPSPYYFNHHMAIELAGCRVVVVPTDEAYQLDLSALQLAITPRTRAIVTVSPNNPTGAVYSQQALEAVNQLCRQHGCYHIADEAYEYFTYGDVKHFSPASMAGAAEHTISLYSLSKAYGMAGWRCGYMLAPQHLLTSLKKVQDTLLVCPPLVSQLAATAALSVGRAWMAPYVAQLTEVRELALKELSQLPGWCRVSRPEGAFYLFAQLDTELNDMQLVQTLVSDYKVAVLPGSTFGATNGCALRISFGSLTSDRVAEGLRRLRCGLQSLL